MVPCNCSLSPYFQPRNTQSHLNNFFPLRRLERVIHLFPSSLPMLYPGYYSSQMSSPTSNLVSPLPSSLRRIWHGSIPAPHLLLDDTHGELDTTLCVCRLRQQITVRPRYHSGHLLLLSMATGSVVCEEIMMLLQSSSIRCCR